MYTYLTNLNPNKMKTQITILVMLFLTFTDIHAQDTTGLTSKSFTKNPRDRVFGIGLKTFNLINDLQEINSVLPGNRIVLTFNVTPNLRVQPEIGYNRIKKYSDVLDEDLASSNKTLGIGIYGMWKKEKTNLYAGLKYVSSNNHIDDIQTNYSPNPPYGLQYEKIETTVSNNSFGLVFGGEYFLSNHFSVGTEVGFLTTNIKAEIVNSSQDPVESSSFNSETNIVLRFYF